MSYKSSIAASIVDDEEEIMREVCTSNGLLYSRLRQEGLSCLCLEMFFSGYPRMVGLHNFPNLQVLRIVGQAVKKIDGLRSLPKLKELWIIECSLKSMAGLEDTKQLRCLYLYSNAITKIEHLEHMTELQSLWLNSNSITVIEGLANLKQLKELNLAENWIDKIGNSLNNLQRLEILELSGNRIYSFKDLTNLSRLGSLRSLGFKAPIYPPSGVGLLCNYAVHVIYHLSQLTELDSMDISNRAIKDTVDTIVNRKKIFYGMRTKMLQRKLTDIQSRLTAVKDYLRQPYETRIRVLCAVVKEIDKEIYDVMADEEGPMSYGSGTESDQDAKLDAKWSENRTIINAWRSKQKLLKERIKQLERKLNDIEAFYSEAMDRAKFGTDSAIHQIVIELETGGNIRLEMGKPTDPWFVACQDLVMSRFCAKDFRDFHITGVQIQRITRIGNRKLRARFDDALQSYLDDDESYLPSVKQNAYKKQLEYLFWVWDPELTRGQIEPARTIEEGFMSASTYEQLGRPAAVPLTNSIRIADKRRIDCCLQNNDDSSPEPFPFRNGYLIIAKAYIGKSVQCERSTRIDSKFFSNANADSAYCVMKDSCTGSGDQCECVTRQCEWFIFNHELVIPEYIVEFEYVTLLKSKSPFHDLLEAELASLEKEPRPVQWPELSDVNDDNDVLRSGPEIKQRPRLVALSEELLLKLTRADSLSTITVLNLSGNGLIRLKYLQMLTLLKRLIVSFNDLTKLDDLAEMDIEYIDASFNKITTIEGLKSMSKLRSLDLSWNQMQNTREEISWLRKHAPQLSSLDVRHNPWQKPESMRLRILGRIRSLTRFNGVPVTESEITAALRMAAGSRISQVTLLSHARIDVVPPRTLSLMSTAQNLAVTSRLKPDRVTGEQDVGWHSQITSLCLDGQHISKLSGLEHLTNLRWASFNNNYLTKIEGLDKCNKLEELSLDGNCIRRLEGLSSWPHLRRLSIAHNYITTLDGAGLDHHGHQLQYLSIESNCVSTLSGLQHVVGLVELYASNNLIDSIRETFYLKNLPNLIIVDLYGNPVSTSVENYRLFVIYHLKTLKALDGLPVESVDNQLAKEMLGGRMSQDFVAERLGHSNFSQIRELDCPQCGIQTVDLGNGQLFQNVRSVNLEHNALTSFSGLVHLPNLKVLCLNHNRIESILPRPRAQQAQARSRQLAATNITSSNGAAAADAGLPMLEKLEVLHLSYNGIKDMATLQLGRLPSLKALFLQGNEISKIEGLDNLKDLLELVLDRNKIKSIGEYSFLSQRRLQELHIEENRLRSLANIGMLENLHRLYVGMNRIQDMSELERLQPLAKLTEISLVNNAVAKRLTHRPILVYNNPSLQIIDGITVTDEERMKAQLYFADHQQQSAPPLLMTALDTTLPGITQYKTHIPVKVTNVQLLSPPNMWGSANTNDDTELHRAGNINAKKRGGGGRSLDSIVSSPQVMSTLPHQHGSNSSSGSTGGTMSYHHHQQHHYSNSSNNNSSGKAGGGGGAGGLVQLPPTTSHHYQSGHDYADRYTKGGKR